MQSWENQLVSPSLLFHEELFKHIYTWWYKSPSGSHFNLLFQVSPRKGEPTFILKFCLLNHGKMSLRSFTVVQIHLGFEEKFVSSLKF